MQSGNIFKGRWTIWILALFFALLAGFGTLMLVGSAAERVEYFVVKENVAARTPITQDMVGSVSAPADAVPPTALTVEEVLSGNYYAKIALVGGTVLTKSVVTEGLDPLSADLPEGYVLGSLVVSPENAAGGRIKRGDFVDVSGTTGQDANSTAKVVLHKVLVMDVTVAPDTVANAANNGNVGLAGGTEDTTDPTSDAPGPDSAALYGGIPQVYTFAIPAEIAPQLALLRYADPFLTLTTPEAGSELAAYADGSSMFSAGNVPALSGSSSSSSTSDTSDTTEVDAEALKSEVETFGSKYAAIGATLKVENGVLFAYDAQTEKALGKVDLQGGKYDITSGVFTPKA